MLMKLNSDCVRDILMMVEDVCDFNTVVEYSNYSEKHEHIDKYSHDEIIYHIKQCEQAGLIEGVDYYDDGDYIVINDLTPSGHDFLANIRQDTVWNGIKKHCEKSRQYVFICAYSDILERDNGNNKGSVRIKRIRNAFYFLM